MRALMPSSEIIQLFLPLFDFFPAAPEQTPKSNRILFFGNQRPYKGLDLLVRAMPGVIKAIPDATLHIAGEIFYSKNLLSRFGKKSQTVSELVTELGLQQSVFVDSRYVPDAELGAMFGSSAIAAFPFRSTNQSGSLNLAFGFGVPVVATRVGGLSEYVEDGKNGLLVEPENPDALAAGIVKLLRERIPADSVHASTQRFSWTAYLEQFRARVL